jgi:amino acid transporter
MLLAAILATLSSLNVSLVAASRNLFALSRDGYVPKIFSSIQKKYKTPYISLLFSAFISLLFVASRSIGFIAYLSSFGYLFAFCLVSSSLFILRKKRKYLKRPFKLPFYKFFSFVGFVLPLILILFLESSAIITGIAWMIIGFFVYTLHTLGVNRFRMAFGGMNIFISILSFTLWFSLNIGFPSVNPFQKLVISYTSLILGIVTLVSGVLFIKKTKILKREEKSQK